MLLSNTLCAQGLTGLWVGNLHNDSASIRKDQSFEIALTEYRGKVYGYSRSEFIVNDTLYYILKRVKGTIKGDVCEVEDDEIVSYNFRGKLDKGVKVTSTFRRNKGDSTWYLDGHWKTNATKKYYSVSGKLALEEEKDLMASKIFPHLEELNMAGSVAFYKEQKEQNEYKPMIRRVRSEKIKTEYAARPLLSDLDAVREPSIREPNLVKADFKLSPTEIPSNESSVDDPAASSANARNAQPVTEPKKQPAGEGGNPVSSVTPVVLAKANTTVLPATQPERVPNIVATNSKTGSDTSSVMDPAAKPVTQLHNHPDVQQGQPVSPASTVAVSQANTTVPPVTPAEPLPTSVADIAKNKQENNLPARLENKVSPSAVANESAVNAKRVGQAGADNKPTPPVPAQPISDISAVQQPKQVTGNTKPTTRTNNNPTVSNAAANKQQPTAAIQPVITADNPGQTLTNKANISKQTGPVETNAAVVAANNMAITGTADPKKQADRPSVSPVQVSPGITEIPATRPPAINVMEKSAIISGRRSEFSQEVQFVSDSLELALYDNGEIDGDTVSVYFNGEILMAHQGLKASAIKKTISIPRDQASFTLVMFAESLGTRPPNTGLLVVHDGDETYYVRFSSDFQKSTGIVFKRKNP